jgi:predicted PurR-regulated permease PerM
VTPHTKKTLVRLGAGIAFLLVLIWFMRALESLTTVVMVALILAYVFNPLVKRLNSWGVSRSIAALCILCVGLTILVGIPLLLVPMIFKEITAFAARAPRYVSTLQDLLAQVEATFNLSVPHEWHDFTTLLVEPAKQFLPKMAHPAMRMLSTAFLSTVHVLSTLLHLLLIPLIWYYFLVSFEHIKEEFYGLVPSYARGPVSEKLGEIDLVLAGFIRGQATIALILGILYVAGFMAIGIDLAVVLGLLAGLFGFVPFMGSMTALIFGSIMALIKYGDAVPVLYVVAWVEGVHLVEHYFLTPRIVGHAVGLHPVVYILSLLTAAHLFGFVGILVAIPVTAVLKVLLMTGIDAYRNSYLYHDHPH